jgi:hypothetical protein
MPSAAEVVPWLGAAVGLNYPFGGIALMRLRQHRLLLFWLLCDCHA